MKILIRGLYRNALYTWINIVGLAVSLTVAIFILLWVQDEWNYDRFYDRSDDIFQVFQYYHEGGSNDYVEVLPTPLAFAINGEVPEIEIATIYGRWGSLSSLEYEGQKYFPSSGYDWGMADSCFFQIFNMNFIEGNPQDAFPDPYSIVVTDEFANIVFKNENPIGKVLKGDNGNSYHVTGVVEKPSQNSQFQFKILLSFEQSHLRNDWNNHNYPIFIRLNSKANLASIVEKIEQLYKRHTNDDVSFSLQPLSKAHLYAPDGSETAMKSVRIFLIVAIVLLLIACVNYVNLVTARAHKRTKEISIRKIVGATRIQLFIQMMGETLFLLFFAIAFASVLLYLLTPLYATITDKQLVFNLLNKGILFSYLGTICFVVVLAGVYPAIYLSSFKVLNIFRGRTFAGSKFSFRKILIVLQFSCSVAFILGTIVMSSQQRFMQTKDLGYNRENVFTIELLKAPNARKALDIIKNELLQQSCIAGVAASQYNIMYRSSSTRGIYWEGRPEDIDFSVSMLGVDKDFFDLLNIQIVEGQKYNGASVDSLYLFINEEAVKRMNLKNPINTAISFGGRNTGRVLGVVKDFHFEHMSKPIGPALIYLARAAAPSFYLYVKVKPGKEREAIGAVEQIWKKVEPEGSLSYQFMDDTFNAIYRDDIRSRNLFNAFAAIAIFISCLGLFGLATYTAEARTKEIGIRKTLGASTSGIVGMLSKEFVMLVSIATVVGIPIAYYFMNKLLQSYAYRISIAWWMIFTAILVVLVLVVLTVSAQALRAAKANPVKAIKTE